MPGITLSSFSHNYKSTTSLYIPRTPWEFLYTVFVQSQIGIIWLILQAFLTRSLIKKKGIINHGWHNWSLRIKVKRFWHKMLSSGWKKDQPRYANWFLHAMLFKLSPSLSCGAEHVAHQAIHPSCRISILRTYYWPYGPCFL